MMKAKPFKGANVFMSRNLVAPEIFDALLDALKLNGADVFLCCDPSRTGANDFHVISSSDHVTISFHFHFISLCCLRFFLFLRENEFLVLMFHFGRRNSRILEGRGAIY